MNRSSSRIAAAACLHLALVAPLLGDARAAAPGPSAADDLTSGGDRSLAPYLELDRRPATDAELTLMGAFADVDVAGAVAHVTVTQHFQNRVMTPIEAVYVFPASTRAAVTGMRIVVGDRVIEAQIREESDAKAEYDAAKATGHTAGLLEARRPNVFSMSVANILPGESVVVELDYVERLEVVDGEVELVYPALVGPRYESLAPGPAAAPAPAREVLPYLPVGYPWRVIRGLSVTLAAPVPIVAVSSPSHAIDPALDGDGGFTFEHLEVDEAPRDFVLRWRLGGDEVTTGALVYDAPDGERFFLATVAPPTRVPTPENVLPRDYVFVIDVSGSMRGWPLVTASALVRDLARGLRPADRFNIVAFAGSAGVLSPTPLPPTEANIERASAELATLVGGGGTELAAALETTLALPASPGLVRTVVVVTDGFIDAERAAFELIREHLGEVNVFAFGIGDSPNRFLIEGLARAGGGEPFIAANEAQAAEVAARFRAVVSAPLLTDATVSFEGVDAYDVTPGGGHLPTVYAARPLVVLGKLRGPAAGGLVRFRGRAAGGPWEAVIDLGRARRGPALAALRALWARERVAELSDGGGSGADAARRAAIVAIGLRYGLLTEHTSFVAVDPRARAGAGAPGTVRVPQPAAGASMGWSGGGGGGSLQGMGAVVGTGFGGGGGVGSGGSQGGGSYGLIRGGGGGEEAGQARFVVKVAGALDAEAVRRALQRRASAFRRLYERALAKQPKLPRKFVFHVRVDAAGKVTDAAVRGWSVDAELEARFVRLLRSLHLPAASGGTMARVTVGFGPR